jgi:class 3 adenylate cyclase
MEWSMVEVARDALGKRAWPEAFEAFAAADTTEPLEPEDLEGMAKAGWWTGRPNESIEARERAYAAYVERGDKARAAFVALTLRREYTAKLQSSVAQGWLTRAETLLDGEPESTAHGYLAVAHAQLAWGRGELDHAISHVERAIEIAGRFDDRDLPAWTDMYKGMILVDMGRVEEGWLLMEAVSAAAVGGELGGYTTGGIFCNTISMCRDLADYGRATEWADAAKRWCERQAITGFPGVCRVHRAEVMRLVGAWTEAEREVRQACDELREFSPLHAGAAFHELGEVRLRVGDFSGAEEAFAQAHEMGEDPQPGRSLLLLAEGKVDSAVASIRRSLDDLTWERLARGRLLPAQALMARETGDVVTARSAADELASIAEEYGTAALRASAEGARGIVRLLEADAEGAVRSFRRACQLWREVDAPYETSKTSLLLAEAYLEAGDEAAASMEIRSARSTFERLGAAPDERRAAEFLAAVEAKSSAGTRAVRTFMFTDIVGSTALIDVIGDAAWRDLQRWHDEALRKCFAIHAGEEVDHAGDGFFVAFPGAGEALACAVEVQRRLTEHRREHGFAPQVRIGLHATEATRAGTGFSGRGVHEAARIGALAAGGEIVASEDTLDGVDNVTVADSREVALKGIPEPVRIVTIDWRQA